MITQIEITNLKPDQIRITNNSNTKHNLELISSNSNKERSLTHRPLSPYIVLQLQNTEKEIIITRKKKKKDSTTSTKQKKMIR